MSRYKTSLELDTFIQMWILPNSMLHVRLVGSEVDIWRIDIVNALTHFGRFQLHLVWINNFVSSGFEKLKCFIISLIFVLSVQTHVKTNFTVPYELCFGFCESNFSSLRERRFWKCHGSTVGRMFIIIDLDNYYTDGNVLLF